MRLPLTIIALCLAGAFIDAVHQEWMNIFPNLTAAMGWYVVYLNDKKDER